MKRPANIDDYIADFPQEVKIILEQVRTTVRKYAPEAEEVISYGIPAFKLNGRILVYFAGYKKHISIYPAPRGIAAFKKEISAYKGGKGTVQFPLGKRLPSGLLTKIVKFKVKENLAAAKAKKK